MVEVGQTGQVFAGLDCVYLTLGAPYEQQLHPWPEACNDKLVVR